MKAKDHAVFEEGERNFHQPLNASVQIISQEFPIDVYPQNGELFSRGMDAQQTGETSLRQLHYNNLDDILARIKLNPRIVAILDDLLMKVAEDFAKGGHSDNLGNVGHNWIG